MGIDLDPPGFVHHTPGMKRLAIDILKAAPQLAIFFLAGKGLAFYIASAINALR